MKPTTDLPDDPALPGLAAIRAVGLALAIPVLGLGDALDELRLCGYTRGARATVEARAGDRHFAIKAYADDPAPEAELYAGLAAAGLTGASGPRVPPLLSWDRNRRVLVIGWLEGPTLQTLVRNGQGERAGDLAARWFRRVAEVPLRLGSPVGAARMLDGAFKWVAALTAADARLGAAATALGRKLARTLPVERAPRLVHGTLYDRHILDLGDGPGVIDWENFGHGPLELDAGMFLGTLWRHGLDNELLAGAVARAERAFLDGTRGLLDEHALAWHRAAALLRLAAKVQVAERRKDRWLAHARALLGEAERLAELASRPGPVVRAEAPVHRLGGAALELVLQALSTRPATPEELDQLRRLLEATRERKP